MQVAWVLEKRSADAGWEAAATSGGRGAAGLADDIEAADRAAAVAMLEHIAYEVRNGFLDEQKLEGCALADLKSGYLNPKDYTNPPEAGGWWDEDVERRYCPLRGIIYRMVIAG